MHSSECLTRDTLRIGFIGLGNMGLPMARRLLEKSGCPVYGFDIVSAALEKLAAAGGTPEPDSTALLEKAMWFSSACPAMSWFGQIWRQPFGTAGTVR